MTIMETLQTLLAAAYSGNVTISSKKIVVMGNINTVAHCIYDNPHLRYATVDSNGVRPAIDRWGEPCLELSALLYEE